MKMSRQSKPITKMSKTLKYTLALSIATLILSACSSKPASETYYYLLDQAPTEHISTARAKLLEVAPIVLPRYLKQQNLLMLGDENRLTRANYHYWADDLAPSVRRTLIRHLNNHNDIYSAVADCSACPQVVIQIDHFYPTINGKVILSGNYQFKENGTGTPGRKIHRESFSFERKIDHAGYAHSVKLMNELLNELSQQIVKSLDLK